MNFGRGGPKVDLTGLEPVTSPLSGVRSDQLSYRSNKLFDRNPDRTTSETHVSEAAMG